MFIVFLVNISFAQNKSESSNTNTQAPPRNYLSFRHHNIDKYYMGWMNPRAFITRAFIRYNFNFREAVLYRNASTADTWNFNTITAIVEGRIATEFYFYRNRYVGVGAGAAFELPLVMRQNIQLTSDRKNILNIYSLIGQFAGFIDVFLPYNLRLRIIPFYHESVHIADGYIGDPDDFSFISYEFMSFDLYAKIKDVVLYTGFEVTYSTAGETERVLRTRLQFGIDYRYSLYKNLISLIMGVNVAALYDENNKRFPETSGWHPAINMAVGFEFDRLVTSLKYSGQRGFESVTYQTFQHSIGMEITVFF